VDSLQISISVGGIYFCGRALQSPMPSASGDASYNLVEWSTFSVKLPFFSRIWARDRKIFTGVFPNLGLKIFETVLTVF